MPEKMSTADLKVLLTSAKQDAMNGLAASDLVKQRTDALKYYLGDMTDDMPAASGRSKAVSTDVADTVEGLMPPLMEIFCGSDEVVRFEPVGPEDVPQAEQETDYVNHVFMQKNPGFLILYSFIKDALLSKTGIVKIYWDEHERETRETYLDQSDDAFAMLAANPEVEIVAHSAKPAPYQPQPGQPEPNIPPMLHDVTVVQKKTYACAKVEPVPPEEFGIERRARSVSDCNYCFHEVIKTESDLIDQGFDEDQVKALPSHAMPHSTEDIARDTVAESALMNGDATANKAIRPIRVVEHYIRMDYDGSGKARLYRVTTGGEQGDVLLRDGEPEVVEEDMVRFAAMTPVILTHRFFGRSIADLVMDIQRIKTALIRAMLDNAYLANNARAVVSEQDSLPETLDDLLVSRPGGLIRVKQNAQSAVVWQQVPTIGNHVFPLIEYADSVKESRTGVTRQGQGIDADALQNQSATAVNQLYSAAQARIKLIARIFAETGIKDLFSILHATIRQNGQQAETVRLRNNWVQVDPRDWKERNDLTINVGLGSGGKSERIQQINVLANWQKQLLEGGKSNLVTDKNLYGTAKEFTKLLELKNTEAYFTDPASPEGQQASQMMAQRPDPKMAEVQGKLQMQGQQAQMQMQMDGAKHQADMQLQQAKIAAGAQADQAKVAADTQAKERQLQAEIMLKREQMAAEIGLKREQMLAELALQREQMILDAQTKVHIANSATQIDADTRMGGEPG